MCPTPFPSPDDLVAAFQIEGEPVRGRLVRLGPAVDEILTRHDYPEPVANLLGEACALAALVGSSLKFEGRLIVQAQGDGPVRLRGRRLRHLRRPARLLPLRRRAGGRGRQRLRPARRQDPAGRGRLHHDHRPGRRTWSATRASPRSRARPWRSAPSSYFAQSEQTPTRVRLAVGQVDTARARRWRAGGMLIQNIAEDDARGSTDEAWDTAQALFETLGEDELIDPTCRPSTLLYRLFHEDGVRLFEPKPLRAFCRCSQERIEAVLQSFAAERARRDGRGRRPDPRHLRILLAHLRDRAGRRRCGASEPEQHLLGAPSPLAGEGRLGGARTKPTRRALE